MDEVARILEEFSDFLEMTNPISYMLRLIGWVIIKGLAWLVDSLSNITDSILGLKMFYDSIEITSFVEFLIPLSVILMGFSLLHRISAHFSKKGGSRIHYSECVYDNVFFRFDTRRYGKSKPIHR
ncbi:hypothetical protein FC682_26290 [Peribacillus simplex]|uniref:hypothetical protein n=1 Tax=Peribacillus simplex TaxID=1478 RepID=UPI0010BF47AA|nr:hypothetical protein [Peribacillus simplex]TKG98620.1 hypothetical protein FC682_26290 [Peribacillus simplex]